METAHLNQSLETAKEIFDQYKLKDKFSLIRKLYEQFDDPMEQEFMIDAFHERLEQIEQQMQQISDRVHNGELTWTPDTLNKYMDVSYPHYQFEILAGSLSIISEAHKQKYTIEDVLDQIEKLHGVTQAERATIIKRFLKTKAALKVADRGFMEKRPMKRGAPPSPDHPNYEVYTRIMVVVEDLRKAIRDIEASVNETPKKKEDHDKSPGVQQEKMALAQQVPNQETEEKEPTREPLSESEPEHEQDAALEPDTAPVPSMDAIYDAVTDRYDMLRELGIELYDHVHYMRINKDSISDVIRRAQSFADELGFLAGLIRGKKRKITGIISDLERLSGAIDEQQKINKGQA